MPSGTSAASAASASPSSGSGSAGYHPSVLLGLLVYGYATGVFASRKLERATYDSVAFRFIAANEHPDHDRAMPEIG
jgi:transposase